jgi:SP family sugar:H+ symporter-like MFS transporter
MLMCAFAAFAGMLFGYDSGYISSVLGMRQFKLDYGHIVSNTDQNAAQSRTDPDVYYDYSTWQKSLIVSAQPSSWAASSSWQAS